MKELLSLLAILLTFIAFAPYIHSILKGKTKPHVFSWIIWGITTLIVSFAQLADKGGAGAWPTGISGATTAYIAWLAYRKHSDITITLSDWVFFIVALSSLPFWYFTSNPLWAVVILTTVDTLGFYPTARKAYHKPYEEQLLLYILTAVRNVVSIAALEHYSFTTLLFPAVMTLACAVFIAMVGVRRRTLVHEKL